MHASVCSTTIVTSSSTTLSSCKCCCYCYCCCGLQQPLPAVDPASILLTHEKLWWKGPSAAVYLPVLQA